MRKVLILLSMAGLVIPQATAAQSMALEHIMRYKRPTACTWTTSGLLIDINPADTSKLWQTITATTAVTTDGDVVGTAQDSSGNAFDLTATANDTTRPLYKTSGGLSWLEFDGTNDVLRRVANLGLYSGGAMTLEIAYKQTSSQQTSLVAEGNSGLGNPYYDPFRHNTGSPVNITATIRDDAGSFQLNGGAYYPSGFTINADGVMITTDSGSSITGYLDGSSAGASPQSYSRTTHTNADTFSLGARIRTTTDSYFIGRIYRLRAFNRVLNSTEIANDTTCLKATQGR